MNWKLCVFLRKLLFWRSLAAGILKTNRCMGSWVNLPAINKREITLSRRCPWCRCSDCPCPAGERPCAPGHVRPGWSPGSSWAAATPAAPSAGWSAPGCRERTETRIKALRNQLHRTQVLQSSELGLPQPLSHRRVCHLHPGSGWRGHTRWRERGWESPNSDEGTYTVVLCDCLV